MPSRSQLNIKISPELLQKVRASALKRGLTVTDFVVEALTSAVDDGSATSIAERLERIERHLGLEETV